MKKPTIITTPSGDRLAVLPLEDYVRLVEAAEDAADIRAIDEFETKIASGEEEFIPAEFAHRMIDGESKVRVWRQYRGLSQHDLAAKAAVSNGDLSQIEDGTQDATFGTMKRIAAALGLTVDDLA